MRRSCGLGLALLWVVLGACSDPSEAPRVELPVLVDSSGMEPVTTALGYEVTLSSARLAFKGVIFTVAGEVHTASLFQRAVDWIVPAAHAHPGHSQGGEVTGELVGEFVVDWAVDGGRQIGLATLIAGSYQAADFTFRRATADELAADDPLIGHTAILEGMAEAGGKSIRFTIVVDSPVGRELVGAPFAADIPSGATGTLGLMFNPQDAVEGDTLFDSLDFGALDADGDGIVVIEPDVADVEDAYNTFRREFQSHDHYEVSYQN